MDRPGRKLCFKVYVLFALLSAVFSLSAAAQGPPGPPGPAGHAVIISEATVAGLDTANPTLTIQGQYFGTTPAVLFSAPGGV